MQIKALDTDLWGYKFRSRLEARWAVFFDRMGIEWQYETQGFMLPSGPYLPDFFLPKWGLWFEVKGRAADEEERQRCYELSFHENGVLLAEGQVGEKPLSLFAHDIGESNGGSGVYQAIVCHQLLAPGDDDFVYLLAHLGSDKVACNSSFETLTFCVTSPYKILAWEHDERIHLGPCRVTDAITAARSARFEHGQAQRRLHGC